MAVHPSAHQLSENRAHLLRAAATFLQEVIQESGVLRIALIGSILTAKNNPKDIDILLSVEDGLGLERIARAGRRLKGRAQQKNLGADIFLANHSHSYIGRICGWRECAPGIRMACKASHCGGREYLNDDLKVIKLKPDLLAEPPIVVWPTEAIRIAVPPDVAELLKTVRKLSSSPSQIRDS